MTGELINHLWQSTIFAAAAGLLALAFRKNRAQVRYWLWLAASVKFLVPFSVLMSLGSSLWAALAARGTVAVTEIAAPAVSAAMERVAQPFPADASAFAPTAATTSHWMAITIFIVWACGFAALAVMRLRGWLRVRAILRASVRVDIPSGVASLMEVRSCAGSLEPGVVGLLRPVLLLPEGILRNLTASQLEELLAHELTHVRRGDNLTATVQMIVEAVFWFYPVVWWIGARLVEERERACDEAVLSLGNAPRDYADAIVSVCKMYAESPVACVAGISGADLKKRIVRIMKCSLGDRLTLGRKFLLGAAALAVLIAPVVFGLAAAQQDAAPPSEAEQLAQQAAQFGPGIKYDVVSIRLNKSVAAAIPAVPGPGPSVVPLSHARSQFLPDGLTFRDTTFGSLFRWAYAGTPPYLIFNAPGWWNSEKYDVLAKTNGTVAEKLKKLPFNQLELARSWMIQELLAERFQLKVHWETRQLPRYAITVAKVGPKFKQSPPGEWYGDDTVGVDGKRTPSGGKAYIDGPGQAQFVGITMVHFASDLELMLGRPLTDETGLTGRYDFKLRWDPSQDQAGPGGTSAFATPAAAGNQPALAASTPSGYPGLRKAIEQQLGLQLREEVGPVRVLVIDHVEKPSEN